MIGTNFGAVVVLAAVSDAELAGLAVAGGGREI